MTTGLSIGPIADSRPAQRSLITLDVKHTGKPSAGNPHAGFDAAGAGNQLYRVWRQSSTLRMSRKGRCIQWESNPPEQKSEFCSLDSREGRKLNFGSLS